MLIFSLQNSLLCCKWHFCLSKMVNFPMNVNILSTQLVKWHCDTCIWKLVNSHLLSLSKMVNFAVNYICFLCKYRRKKHNVANVKFWGCGMVHFATNGNFASSKWYNFALKGFFFSEIMFPMPQIAVFPAK